MNRGIHRETVARYDRLRQSKPANPTPGSGDEDLSKPANATPGSIPPGGNLGPPSYCQPFAEIIKRKLETGLSGQWIWQDLVYPICRLVKCYTSGLLLTSFYCPADACRASVPDVTKLVTKFHGLANITPCPDYPPLGQRRMSCLRRRRVGRIVRRRHSQRRRRTITRPDLNSQYR